MIPKRQYRILTQGEINARKRLGLPLDPRVLRKQGMILPVEGAEENDDSDDDSKNKDDSEDDDKKDKASGSSDDDDKDKKDDDKDKDDDDSVRLSKNEVARLRRIAKEKEAADKKAKSDKDSADRKRKQEEGRYEELLSDEREKTVTAEKERDTAKEELADFKFQVGVNKVAGRLGFKDPSDAYLFLDKKELLDADEDVIESALKKVLKNKDYLKSDRRATGGAGNGRTNGSSSFSFEDIKKMSVDEINANWDKPGFQEAMKQTGG